MVPAGNKAKRLSSVNHATKRIHRHHHHHHHHYHLHQDKNLLVNFQKFEKFENKKSVLEIMLFFFSFLRFLTVSKAIDEEIRNASCH